MIDRPLRRDGHIPGRHGRGDRLVPTGEGIAFSCWVGGRGDGCAVVLRDGCDFTATGGVEGDGVLIDRPLRPIFLIAHFCTADCHHRIAGQAFVVIPALERVAGIGHIVGCRECCAHTVDVFGDIAVVDRAAVRIQGYGVDRGCPLHRQFRHISRNTAAGFVGIAIAVKPHKIIIGISGRAGQTVGRRGGKCAAVFHDDLNSTGAAAQLAAAKVKGNDLQSARVQFVSVQDFKDGAETEARAEVHSIVADPVAGRTVPANRTARRVERNSILSPRIHFIPVSDISAVLVQYPVPFII